MNAFELSILLYRHLGGFRQLVNQEVSTTVMWIKDTFHGMHPTFRRGLRRKQEFVLAEGKNEATTSGVNGRGELLQGTSILPWSRESYEPVGSVQLMCAF